MQPSIPMNDAVPARVPLWRRLAAAAYDALVVVALWFIGTALVMPLSHGAIVPNHPFAELFYRLYLLAIGFAFFGGFWVRNGQTLGMLAWRVKVVSTKNAGRITWRQALIRYLGACVPWAIFVAGGGVQEYQLVHPSLLVSAVNHLLELTGLIVIFFVYRRAPLRFGGITWYDSISGTELHKTASFSVLSNPKS